MVRSEGNLSLKNAVTPLGIDPGTVRLVAQRLNHYATPDPICKFAANEIKQDYKQFTSLLRKYNSLVRDGFRIFQSSVKSTFQTHPTKE